MAIAAAPAAIPASRSVTHATSLWLHRSAILAVLATILLFAWDGAARGSDAALSCIDGPACYSLLVPPWSMLGWEWVQRVLIAGHIVAALAVAAIAWGTQRRRGYLLAAATLVPGLLAVQAGLEATLPYLLDTTVEVVVSFTASLLVLGLLSWVAVASRPDEPLHVDGLRWRRLRLSVVAWPTTLLVLLLLIAGAYLRAAGGTNACPGFLDCGDAGSLRLGASTGMDTQFVVRLVGLAAGGLVLWVVLESLRLRAYLPGIGTAGLLLGLSFTAEGVLGVVIAVDGAPPFARSLHQGIAAAAWSSLVLLMAAVSRPSGIAHTSRPAMARTTSNRAATARAYFELTKPRVMSLLLATTLGAMIVASRGFPDPVLTLWTLLGGALMAGGAGAINHYLDRDIDPLMGGRTSERPIPMGQISPARTLGFGLLLAGVSFILFIVFVNLLAAVLAVCGLLGYVFVYTLWLKRNSPSNIVIGGAAGAIPPLVGWAAVTGSLTGPVPWYLFALIFFWTPPHFWALALLIQEHYERASIPMLPVVRGEGETRRQILLYSLILVPLSLLLTPVGGMGLVYFVLAACLGGFLLLFAVRLLRQPTRNAARTLYLYSLLYLFGLFAAMAVDSSLPTSFV